MPTQTNHLSEKKPPRIAKDLGLEDEQVGMWVGVTV